MREKYVEERFPRYFIFGEHPTEDTVDVSDGAKDVLAGISKENANSIIQERDTIITFLWKLADAFDKADKGAFSKFWYEDSAE